MLLVRSPPTPVRATPLPTGPWQCGRRVFELLEARQFSGDSSVGFPAGSLEWSRTCVLITHIASGSQVGPCLVCASQGRGLPGRLHVVD